MGSKLKYQRVEVLKILSSTKFAWWIILNIRLFEGDTTWGEHLRRIVSECEAVFLLHLEINLNIGTAVFNLIIHAPAITAPSEKVLRRA